jgi:hypothetical protein
MFHTMTAYFLLTASIAMPAVSCATEAVAQQDFLSGVIQLTEQGSSKAIPETVALLKELQEKGVVLRTGADAELRPSFVGAQLDIERYMTLLLRMGKISQVKGIIHTPAPATPLCKAADREIPNGLVAAEISVDEKRAYTVKERAVYIREFLASGGELIIAYPKNGRALRSEKELAVYETALKNYPTLKDKPLPLEAIPEEIQGATYLFLDEKGTPMVFSIRSYQANDPKDGREWGVWFGPLLTHSQIQQRFSNVSSFISK